MKVSGFILEYTTKDGALIVLEGSNVKYWEGLGLPNFEGGLEGFLLTYPQYAKELVKAKVIREVV